MVVLKHKCFCVQENDVLFCLSRTFTEKYLLQTPWCGRGGSRVVLQALLMQSLSLGSYWRLSQTVSRTLQWTTCHIFFPRKAITLLWITSVLGFSEMMAQELLQDTTTHPPQSTCFNSQEPTAGSGYCAFLLTNLHDFLLESFRGWTTISGRLRASLLGEEKVNNVPMNFQPRFKLNTVPKYKIHRTILKRLQTISSNELNPLF